jgi:2-phospho-L-lactate guanylyltransferase
MKATAVIPVKSLANVKRRLSSRLWRAERAELVLRLLARELDVLTRSRRIERIIVVTADERVKTLAESRGATVSLLPDDGVNAAIGAGMLAAQALGAELVFAIHGDLPLIETTDVEVMLQAGEQASFAIAPDRLRSGTNAIAVREGVDVGLHFGDASFRRFLAEAAARSVAARVIARPGLELDLDTPADLNEYRRRLRRDGNQPDGDTTAQLGNMNLDAASEELTSQEATGAGPKAGHRRAGA